MPAAAAAAVHATTATLRAGRRAHALHVVGMRLRRATAARRGGSNAATGLLLESAVLRYMDANRPKRAARTALRAVDFCLSAGYPESAAGVPVREITKVRPDVSDTTPSLVDAVLAVLCAVCSDAFARLKHPRRASRFAFFAAIRFAELRYFAAAAAPAEAIDGSALQRAAVRHHMHYWMGEGAFSQGNSVSAVRHFSSVLVEAKKSAQPNAVGIHASVVPAFLRALKIGAVPKLATRWDSGAAYPLLDTAFSFARMILLIVIEIGMLSRMRRLKRERRIEALISELRYAKRSVQNDPGGSLEMKIRRMRDLAYARKRRKRAASLLERGAVLGEAVLLHTRLRNPLQFPVFIRSMSAVVSLDFKCYSLFDKSNDEAESEPPPVRLFEAPSFTIAPNSEENVVLKITGQKAGVLQCIGVCRTFASGTSATFVPDSPTVFVPGFALLHRNMDGNQQHCLPQLFRWQ
ncbi:hypothetical protein FGB62_241g03 [Gracilaria domingensis]|nr:hypothetical protein FGB62_241g03 [Gracilaria domingensis]